MRFTTLKVKPPPLKIPPVVYISLAATAGTSVANLFPNQKTDSGLEVASFVIVTSILGFCLRTKNQITPLLFVAVFGLFYANTIVVKNNIPPHWLVSNNGDLLELHGTVTSNPITLHRTTGYLSNIDEREPVTTFTFQAAPQENTQANQTKQFFVEVHGTPPIKKGDKIRAIGTIRRQNNLNKQILKLFIPTEPLVRIVSASEQTTAEIEQEIKRRIRGGITGVEKTLVSAVFFGERTSGWNTVSLMFRKAGLAHILAISGLHVAIVVVVALCLFRAASLGKIPTLVLTCLTMAVLFSIIEHRPPVNRAIYTVITASFMQLRGQRYSSLGILSIVAMLIIWSEPQTIKTIGFILSFTTVFGLCLLLRTLQWKLLGPHDILAPTTQATRYKISTLWVVCLCAFVTITPLVLHFFGTISLIGLISGLGGVFLLFILLTTGIARLATGWLHPNIDECMAWVIQNISTTTIDACHQYGALTNVYGLGFLYTHMNPPGWLLSTLFLLTTGFVVLKTGYQKTKITTVLLTIACLVGNNNRNKITITTMSVGHGTSHIIMDETHTTLIDAGSRANLDVGLTVVLPALHRLGINKIDTLILTHNDLDHCSGILDLMHHIEINEICMTEHTLQNQTAIIKKIIQVAKSKDTRINTIYYGWCKSTKNATIHAIWPEKNTTYTSSNESSVVLSIKSHGRRVLLTGDINEKTIFKLLSIPTSKSVDVLEMPHHGQWSKEAVLFINKTNPLVVIQSTGATRFSNDKWVIPKQTDRFVTCIDGDISTTIYKNGELEVVSSKTRVYKNYTIK